MITTTIIVDTKQSILANHIEGYTICYCYSYDLPMMKNEKSNLLNSLLKLEIGASTTSFESLFHTDVILTEKKSVRAFKKWVQQMKGSQKRLQNI